MTARPGGRTRARVVGEARRNVERLRSSSVEGILHDIAAIELIVAARRQAGERLSDAELDRILERAGRLLTITGTFGYALLDAVIKSFCVLVYGLMGTDVDGIEGIAVHLRAMRLASPEGPALSQPEAARILSELERVLDHFRCNQQGGVC